MKQTAGMTLQSVRNRARKDPLTSILKVGTYLGAGLSVGILAVIVVYILWQGISAFSPELFAWNYTTENQSMMPAILNTLQVLGIAILVSVPLGLGAAIWMEEYAPKGSRLVQLSSGAAEILSGIPSIVYGLFGMIFFVGTLHLGLSRLAGALTLALMVLPVVLRTSQEALKAVDTGWREGSYGLGAGRLRTLRKIVLPSALPGIIGGVILAAGRMMGETAALIYTAGTAAKAGLDLLQPGGTLAVHMYKLMSEGLYTRQAAAVAVMLLVLVGIMNLAGNWLSEKSRKGLQ